MLARVRWTNVAVALGAAGILGLVVAWPLLRPDPVRVPPPVAKVGTPQPRLTAAPTVGPAPTPRVRRAKPHPARVHAAPRARERHRVRKQKVPAAVAAPAPAVAAAPRAPVVVAPSPAREFKGFEK